MTGRELAFALNGYDFVELSQAKAVAAHAGDREVDYRAIRVAWDCVSISLDHHQENGTHLIGLENLEGKLAKLGHLALAPAGYSDIGKMDKDSETK